MVRKQIFYFRTTVVFHKPAMPTNIPQTSWQQNLWHQPRGWTSKYQRQGTLISTQGYGTGRNEIFVKPMCTLLGSQRCIVQRSVFPEISFSIDLFTFSSIRRSTPSRVWHQLGVENGQNSTSCLFLQQSIWHVYMVFQCRALKLPTILNSILSHSLLLFSQ